MTTTICARRAFRTATSRARVSATTASNDAVIVGIEVIFDQREQNSIAHAKGNAVLLFERSVKQLDRRVQHRFG